MKQIDVVAAVIEKDGKFFVAKRPKGIQLGGLWEFPGGKVEFEESHEDALKREIREEFDAEISVGDLIARLENVIDGKQIILYFYKAYLKSESLVPIEHDTVAWLDKLSLAQIDLAPGDKQLVNYL